MKVILAVILYLISIAGAIAQENVAPTPYQQLAGEWNKEVQLLKEEYANLSADKQGEMKLRSDDLQKRYTSKFLELAKKHAADEDTWRSCLVWTVVEGAAGRDFDDMIDFMSEQAMAMAEPFNLQLLMANFVERSSQRIDPTLRKFIATHQHSGIRGAALYALGARLKVQGEEAGLAEQCSEAETLLDRAVKEFPTVSTYHGENRKIAQLLLDDLRGPFAIGKVAPAIHGRDIQGVDFSLEKLRGKVVILSFSGHWCGPCRLMHPIERQLVRTYSPQDLVLVEVNSDKNSEAVAAKMLKDDLTWQCVMDGGTKGPISSQWRIREWPTFVVLDREQRIRHKAVGELGDKLGRWVGELAIEK